MPEMSGVDFIKSAKTINPQAECIMMTGDHERATIVDAMKAGASDFVEKPFNLKNLESTLQRAVARLTLIPTLDEIKKQHIAKCVAVSRTDKEAAEKLGINYSTLYRLKKGA
jgi:DNA-binding NtrC family response regulator